MMGFRRSTSGALMASFLALVLASTAHGQATTVLLILDASGSMFLQLEDGQYRITAAKEALTEFTTRLPDMPGLNVGLRVYGSQVAALEDGACEDSALVVPVAGFDRDELLRTIRATQAKGATPIAHSLDLAAQDISGIEGKVVIVLVTDGAESCGGDVRAAIERLTAAGHEVDVRIIGFALSDAAARTFAGLAAFENAASAASLAAALGRAAQVAPSAATYPVTVMLTRRGEPALDGASVLFVDGVNGESTAFAAAGGGSFRAALPAGSYRAEVADAFASASLTMAGLAITPDADNAFTFELEPATVVTIMVTPTDPTAGALVDVRYHGAPPGDNNWLAIAPADAGDDVYLDSTGTAGSSGEAILRIPDEPGRLEVRYHLTLPEGGSRVVGRSPAFLSRAAVAELDAPDEVTAGAGFEVAWQGPANRGDYVTVVPEGAPEGSYGDYFDTNLNPGDLLAPIDAGRYELRYMTGQSDTILARRALHVTPASVSVEAPAEVVAGATFAVTWRGPAGLSDYVTIVPVGAAEGHYESYFDVREGSPGTLLAPIDTGRYEVRYVSNQGYRTLASAPVTITPLSVGLEAPSEVGPGTTFPVVWRGPAGLGDYVTIVPEGAAEGHYESYFDIRDGSPGMLTAAEEAGRYEIRYVSAQAYRTLASVRIEVR